MPSQQSSLSGIRTALTCQDTMARMAASVSVGPSQIPQPSAQAYSAPERLTPVSLMIAPCRSTR